MNPAWRIALIVALLTMVVGRIARSVLLRRIWQHHPDWARREGFPSPDRTGVTMKQRWRLARAIWTMDQRLRSDARNRTLMGVSIAGGFATAGVAIAFVVFAYLRITGD